MELLFDTKEFQKTKFKVKKKKVNIPTSPFEFYYTGENYYYFTEKSREYSESKGIVSSIQNLNINGIDFGDFERVFKYNPQEKSENEINFSNELTSFEIEFLEFNIIWVKYSNHKEVSYFYFKNKKFGPYENPNFYDVTSNGELAFSFIREGEYFIQIGEKEYGPYEEIIDFNLSMDKDKFGFIVLSNQKYYITFSNETFGPYPYLALQKFEWDSQHGKYKCIIKQKGKRFLTIGNQKFGPYDEIIDYKTKWDESSNKFVLGYIVCKINKKIFIITEDKQYGPYDEIIDYETKWDESSNKFVLGYIVCKIKRKMLIILEDKQFGPYEKIIDYKLNWNISNNKNVLGYIIYKRNKKTFLLIDNNEHGPYDEIEDIDIYQKKNKVEIKFMIFKKKGKTFLRIGNKEYGPFDVRGGFGWDYKRNNIYLSYLIYAVKNKWYVKLRNKELGPFDEIYDFGWKKIRGKYSLSYLIYRINNYWFINNNNKIFGPYDSIEKYDVTHISYEPQEGYFLNYVYCKLNEQEYLWLDNKVSGPYDEIINYDWYINYKEDQIIHLIIHLSNGKYYLELGDEKFGPFDDIDNYYISSEYSKIELLNLVYKLNGKYYVLIKKQKIGPFEELRIMYESDDKLIFAGKKTGIWQIYEDNKIVSDSEFQDYIPSISNIINKINLGKFAYMLNTNKISRFYVNSKLLLELKSKKSDNFDIIWVTNLKNFLLIHRKSLKSEPDTYSVDIYLGKQLIGKDIIINSPIEKVAIFKNKIMIEIEDKQKLLMLDGNKLESYPGRILNWHSFCYYDNGKFIYVDVNGD